ncbi:MAG: hypothetical protein HY320_08400 [Armatimonadetes bacterium]|nr:hypothetical protein [Armatimonadota bacterium]
MPNLSKDKLVKHLKGMLADTTEQQPREDQVGPGVHMIGGAGSVVTIQSAGMPAVSGQMASEGPPTLFVSGEGFAARQAFLDECQLDPVLGTQVSREFLATRLDRLVASLYGTATADSIDQSTVREFLKSARDAVKEWTVYLPVDNLVLEGVSTLELGGLTFRPTQLAVPEFVQDSWNSIDTTANTPEQKRGHKFQLAQIAFDAYGNFPTTARTVVNSEAGQAVQITADRIIAGINVLRCFTHLLFSLDSRAYIGLAGTVIHHNRVGFLFAEDSHHVRIDAIGAFQEYVLNPARLEHLRQKCALSRFDEILRKPADERNNLENALFIAAQWIGAGINSSEPAQKILHYTIGLERLLHGQGGEGIADKMATRMAYVIGGSNVLSNYHEAKRLYDLRSKVAHTGESIFPYEDTLKLEVMAVQSLVAVANRMHEWQSQEDLIKWVEQQSFRPVE